MPRRYADIDNDFASGDDELVHDVRASDHRRADCQFEPCGRGQAAVS